MKTLLHFETTGLQHPLLIGNFGDTGPKIQVSNIIGEWDHDDNFMIDLTNKSKIVDKTKVKISKLEIKKIKKWIKQNFNILMKIWFMDDRRIEVIRCDVTNKEFTFNEILLKLKKLK